MMQHAAHTNREFLSAIQACAEPRAVAETLLDQFQNYGFDRIGMRFLPHNRQRPPAGAREAIIAYTMPDAWVEHYNQNRYIDIDQQFRSAIINPRTLWSELRPTYDQDNQRIARERSAFGMNDGGAWSFRTPDGSMICAVLTGERLEYSPEDLRKLDFAATFALGKLITLLAVPGEGGETDNSKAMLDLLGPARHPRARLSPRERETLMWAADGLKTDAIAEKMKISDNGVERNFKVVSRKLGTTTRVHSVAEALRRKLIE
jgi:LuxR family quorum sensing-dependent transcriptional regulator